MCACVFDFDHFNERLLNLPFSSFCTNAAGIQIFVFSHTPPPAAARFSFFFYSRMQRKSIWLCRHVSSCVFTSHLAEVCYWGASIVLCNVPISATRVTLRETKRCHICTMNTSTICLCLSLHTICVLIMFLHLLLFCLRAACRLQSRAPCSFSCPQFLLFLFWILEQHLLIHKHVN